MPALDYVTPDEIRLEYVTQLSTAEVPALARFCTAGSRLMDRYCGRIFYTSTADETFTLDGPERVWRIYYPPFDIAVLTTVEVAADTVEATSGTYTTISTGDWFLRPVAGTLQRPYGWPGWSIELAEDETGTYSNSSQPFRWFQPGNGTVRLTARAGWNTTTVDSTNFPQELRVVAAEVAVRMWRSREAGFSNVIGQSEIGTAFIERHLSPSSREILEHYKKAVMR
jgi:hypothetical protein